MTDSVLYWSDGTMADCPMILPMEHHSNSGRNYFRLLLNQRFILSFVEMVRPNVRAMERAERHA